MTNHQSPITNHQLAINGNHRRYGGVKMRGYALAARYGCLIAGGPLRKKYETVVAMKLGYDTLVRRKCERLIWDPLDAFHPRPNCAPATFWLRAWRALQFNEIIATSPACAESMADALPESVRIHIVPHHCDPSLCVGRTSRSAATHNDSGGPGGPPYGPVVYSGLGRYMDHKLPEIHEACRRLGREFRWDRSQRVLEGAALALCLRCPPTDTRLNRRCKPQIKIENAAAAGLPIVTTDCPAAISLHPQLHPFAVTPYFNATTLAAAMQRAFDAGPVCRPYTVADYLIDMEAVLHQSPITNHQSPAP